MLLLFLAEYAYFFNWSKSCCAVFTQSNEAKQKKQQTNKTTGIAFCKEVYDLYR